MKIYFFDVHNFEKSYIKQAFKDLPIQIVESSLTEQNVADYQDATIISIFLNTSISNQLLEKLPHLKYIVTRTVGYDHIDLAATNKHNIVVSNVPGYGSNTVAEYTFALILALSRNIIAAYDRAKSGFFSPQGLIGFDLKGKTLGVIGTGNIGKAVIKIATGFDMRIVAYDVRQDKELITEHCTYGNTLEEVLEQSDIVSLHIPYQPQTYHLMNKEMLKRMKKGSLLINTSRGEIIDTQALLWALNEKILAGCALDVLEGERELQTEDALLISQECNCKTMRLLALNHALMHKPNVLISPHNAYNSNEAIERIIIITQRNIQNFLNGIIINQIATT